MASLLEKGDLGLIVNYGGKRMSENEFKEVRAEMYKNKKISEYGQRHDPEKEESIDEKVERTNKIIIHYVWTIFFSMVTAIIVTLALMNAS